MYNNTFDAEYDKITVDEVVFKFVQQIMLGAKFKPDNNSKPDVFADRTKLIDFLKKMYDAIPPSIGDVLATADHTVITTDTTKKAFSIDVDGEVNVIRVYLENSGFNITNMCDRSFSRSGGKTKFSFTFDTTFSEPDKIVIFYK